MSLAEKLGKNDLSKLPFDCPAKASERLCRFFNEDGSNFSDDYTFRDYARDMKIVVGDPTIPVSYDPKILRGKLGLNEIQP